MAANGIKLRPKTAEEFVRRSSGVEVASASWTQWTGYARCILQLQWLTEPGWIELRFPTASFFTVVEEIGGRCDFRSEPAAGYQGIYFGIDHATLVAPGEPIVVHAYQLRHATIVCCVLSSNAAVRDDAVGVVSGAPTYLMVKNRPLHDCARLFGGRAADDPDDIFAAALSHSVLLAWADAARRGPGPRSSLCGEALRSVLTYIHDELDESTISSGKLAALAGMSPTQFGKQFQQATGHSPQAWQMDTRVRNAQRLMIDDPAGSLAEFALLCGFADQSHFSRAFLKIVGQSPTEWLNRFL